MVQVSAIRGGENNAFLKINETGQANIEHSFDQYITVRLAFPYTTGTVLQLPNYPCSKCTIQNPLGNGTIKVGSVTSPPRKDAAYPGDDNGRDIYEGMEVTFNVSNTNILMLIGSPQQSFNLIVYPNTKDEITPDLTPPPQPDFVAPTVVSTNPANGATGVATNTVPMITMSEPVDPTTVTNLTVLISPIVAGNAFQDPNNGALIGFQPNANFAQGTAYTITVKGGSNGVKDFVTNPLASDYVFTFTTASAAPPPDTTPPTIASTNPASGATGIATTVIPTVTFSEAMLASTINTSNIQFLNSVNAVMAITLSLSTDKKTVTITPNSSLSNSTTYTIKITTGVTDLAGNHLASQFTSTFTTVAAAYVLLYNVAPTNSYSDLSASSGDAQIDIIFVANTNSKIYNKKPKKDTITMYRVGTLSGNVSVEIIDANVDPPVTKVVLGTIPASTVSTTDQQYTVENVNANVALAVGYGIAVRYSGGTGSSNRIRLKRDGSGSYDGSNTYRKYYDNTGYHSDTSRDGAAVIYG